MRAVLKTVVILTYAVLVSTDNLSSTVTYEQNLEPQTEPEKCTPAAIYEFPSDGLTRQQRKSGWIVVHFLLTCYCFVILAIVCDDHFVPGIQTLVEKLQLSEDVAGASFMAITSASPELFINCVGTFITEGDIGVGTVVGSNVFNILAAPACCGLFAKMAFQFEWWSICRDGFVYAISVIMLILTLHDDKVYWYEALAFVLAYLLYLAVMFYNRQIQKALNKCCKSDKIPEEYTLKGVKTDESRSITETFPEQKTENSTIHVANNHRQENHDISTIHTVPVEDRHEESQIWKLPRNQATHQQVWWVVVWPILVCLKYTMPNCRKHTNLYIFTLLMCMVWIGSISYLLAWLITAIGDTLNIPDSVMGLSFLAIGSSMPEIVTCFIVSRQGQGVMGMSSALGANTFEILLCLGLPWLIKTLFYPKVAGSRWIVINSSGLGYNATCLLSTLVFLYICLVCNRFRLDWKVALICLIMYGVFLVVATLIELNFFFPVNLPICE